MKKLVIYTSVVTLVSFVMASVSASFIEKEDFKNLNINFNLTNDVDEKDLVSFESEKIFLFSQRGRLKIHMLEGKVFVKPGAGNQIRIRLNGQVDKTKTFNIDDHIQQKDDRVLVNLYDGDIKTQAKFFGFQTDVSSVFPGSVRIEIEVPHNFEEIEINGMSADIDISHVNPKRAEFKVVDGEINLDGVKSELIEVKSVSGDIDLVNSSANRFSIHSVSADVDFKSSVDEKYSIEFESLSGEVTGQELFSGASSKLIEINTISGDVEFSRE